MRTLPKLDELDARVVGVLIEKELTTPEQYPLTTNSLVHARRRFTAAVAPVDLQPVVHLRLLEPETINIPSRVSVTDISQSDFSHQWQGNRKRLLRYC